MKDTIENLTEAIDCDRGTISRAYHVLDKVEAYEDVKLALEVLIAAKLALTDHKQRLDKIR